MKTESFRFTASKSSGKVSARLMSPDKVDACSAALIFAHGAGAGMNHPFLEKISVQLSNNGIAAFRFNFPYIEKGKKTPDVKGVAVAAIRAAVNEARNKLPGVPLFAGGKSFGGRMTSTAESEEHLQDVKGIIFFGFPLHPPGKPSAERAEHLFKINIPMLFLQGTRDSLADIKLMHSLCKKLGELAELHIFEGADHSFRVPRSSGINEDDIMTELVKKVKDWTDLLVS